MRLELFDVGFEGTTIRDCLRLQKEDNSSKIVFDSNGTYGSTYKGYSKLKLSKYVKNCVLNKGNFESELQLEAFPALIRPTDDIIMHMHEAGMMAFVEFIKISNHFYIDESGKAYRIPYTKTEIADSNILSLEEKHFVGKLFRGHMTFDEFSQSLSERSKAILMNGIAGDNNTAMRMNMYAKNIGMVPFLYPRHGHKEISEMFSRCNSMCGIGYVLDPLLSVTPIDNIGENNIDKVHTDQDLIKESGSNATYIDKTLFEYSYKIHTSYGDVLTKKVVFSDSNMPGCYVRVINTKKHILEKTFFAFARRVHLMNIIALSSETECCSEETYLIYITKNEESVSDDDLRFLGIQDEDIIEDISYETIYSFKPDSFVIE
ncbi:Rab GDP dissociation inhibitor beta [Ordospora colligata]